MVDANGLSVLRCKAGCCAGHHFKLDRFKIDSARLVRANELHDLTTRLAAHRSDADLLARFKAIQRRFQAYEKAASATRKALPGRLSLQLMRMGPTGAGSVSYWVHYLDENRNREEVMRREERALGAGI